MAKDDTSPGGLFSKMVKFVRSPGTQWNDLDDPSSAKESSISRQVLKEMIERKRRNDFVRKREFDMLRKLRYREANGISNNIDSVARPSFFQSSMPSRTDDRAMTLKKIDEIEAQMSMQWWKTKHGNAASTVGSGLGADFFVSDTAARPNESDIALKSAALANTLAFARTAPDDLQSSVARNAPKLMPHEEGSAVVPNPPVVTVRVPAVSGLAASAAKAKAELPGAGLAPVAQTLPASQPRASADITAKSVVDVPVIKQPAGKQAVHAPVQVAPHKTTASSSTATRQSPASAPTAALNPAQLVRNLGGGLAPTYDAPDATTSFSVSKLFAVEVDEVQHDPELEEAAIRFANLDDSGAEAGLLEAIAATGPRHQHEETWLVLFDLYRATGHYDRFESLALDFAGKFGRSSPNWFSMPEMVSKMTTSEPETGFDGMRKADWKCPAIFGIQTVAALSAALAKAPMPWTLDWQSIQSIDDNAVKPLIQLMGNWAVQPVQLRIVNADKLEHVLSQATPSGIRTVDKSRWDLLMTYMRIAHRPDEFELAALDFCVTYEVSPPSWEPARCEFKSLDTEGNIGARQTIVGDAVHDSIVSEIQTEAGASMVTAQLASVELSGQIMGEPKPVLEKLEARLSGADMIVISCAKLVRVDFAAAGSLLNWVTARQAEGRVVQFIDVHRLVASFFHVIGISEHAKVTLRLD
jgi:ABC-type transporter Mla MlaB component